MVDHDHLRQYVTILKVHNKRPVDLIAPPFIIGFLDTENLPKISSNLSQNHSHVL